MKDRIKKIMESMKMTQQDFAHLIGISTASLSNVFNGRTKPTMNMVEAIHNNIPEISIEWLLFGKEPMYVSGSAVQEPESEPVEVSAIQSFDQDEKHSKEVKQHAAAKAKKPAKDDDDSIKGMNIVDTTRRHITEIRVYFDDLTYETFVPSK